MNTKAIRQLADVTLDKYRSSIPRKAFEEFVKDISQRSGRRAKHSRSLSGASPRPSASQDATPPAMTGRAYTKSSTA